MRFVTLIARNLMRRRTRTLLTATGLAVAIAAVLDLVGIAWNFERSFMALFVGKGIDLVVVRAGISNQLSSTLEQNLAEELRRTEGVSRVALSLMDTVSFEQANIASALINGWESDSLLFRGSRILEGRSFRPDEGRVALLGRVLALNLGKHVGGELDVAGEPFQVIGIYESDSLFESGAMVVPLETLQKMMGREGQVTGFVIQGGDLGADGERVEDACRHRKGYDIVGHGPEQVLVHLP